MGADCYSLVATQGFYHFRRIDNTVELFLHDKTERHEADIVAL